MKFRPRLETLDSRDLPDANPVSIPTPNLPPLGGVPPVDGIYTPPPAPTLQDKIDKYHDLIAGIHCVGDGIGSLVNQYTNELDKYNDLVNNADALIALMGPAAYYNALNGQQQVLNNLWNQIDEQRQIYNALVQQAGQLYLEAISQAARGR